MEGDVQDTPTSVGIDPIVIVELMKLVPRNPETGKVELVDVARFMELNPQKMKEFMTRYSEKERSKPVVNLEKYDYKALAPTIVQESFWVLQLEPAGFVDEEGNAVHESTAHVPGVRPVFTIYCYDEASRCRVTHDCTGLPDSKTVLHALKLAIANPLLPFKASLPWFLVVSIKLSPHTASLKPFLDSLPAPFHWRFETRQEAQTVRDGVYRRNQKEIKDEMLLAEKFKLEGNDAFSKNDRVAALDAYKEALKHAVEALIRKPSHEDEDKAKRLQAICLSNRAATYMLPGEGLDAKQALADGRASERADPSYKKAYVRQTTAGLLLGNMDEAQDAIARALRRKDLENDVGLVDRLVELMTEGKGLSNDEHTFKNWVSDVMVNDEKSSERLSGLKGEWERRMNAHFEKFKR